MAKLNRSPTPAQATNPAPVPLTRPQRLLVLAQRLARTLGIARALAQTGRHVDLTGIEDGIGMLCAQTLDMAPEEGRAMLPLLHELVGQIDLLTATLRQAQPPPPTFVTAPNAPATHLL